MSSEAPARERDGSTSQPAGQDRALRRPRGASRRLGRLAPAHVLVVAAALAAAVANFALLRGAQETVPVLVADAPLVAGDAVPAEGVTIAEVAAGGPVPGALLGPADRDLLEGAVLARPVEEGEPLRGSDLRARAAPEGLRAMSLPVDRRHAVGGALQPGDRIDVIETDASAELLARDVEVLAVPIEEASGVGGSAFAVTVAVEEAVALRLAQALHGAHLDLVRSTGADQPSPAAPDEPSSTSAGEPSPADPDEPSSTSAGEPSPADPDEPSGTGAP